MRTIHFVILFFLILFLSEGYPAVKAGKVMEVSGKTDQLRLDRIDKKLPLHIDDPLFFKDTVLTGDASTAGLHLTPESDSEVKFFVYENSRLKIEPDLLKAGKRHFVAKFNRGLMRLLAKGLKKNNEELQLNLPNCVVGVRGTELELIVREMFREEIKEEAEAEADERFDKLTAGARTFAQILAISGTATVTVNVGTPQESSVTVREGERITVQGTLTSATIATGIGAPTVADNTMNGEEGLRFQGDRRAGFDYFEILKSRPKDEISSVAAQALAMDPINWGDFCRRYFDPTNSRPIDDCGLGG